MAMAHWEMHGWLILLLGWLFVPFYARSGVFTMPEFLERRYNKASRSVLSIISLVSYVLTKVAVTVYAGGVVFKDVFGIESVWGIDFFWISAIGLVVITGIYTALGGMKAVLWTSVLQTPILLLGSIAVLIAGLIKVGGWDELMHICRAVPVNEFGDTMTQLIRSPKDPTYPWTGVLLGSAIIGFWYWCTDQYIVQRVLSGRDQTQSRRGAIFGGVPETEPGIYLPYPGDDCLRPQPAGCHSTDKFRLRLLHACEDAFAHGLQGTGCRRDSCGTDEFSRIALQLVSHPLHHRLLPEVQAEGSGGRACQSGADRHRCCGNTGYPLDTCHERDR